MSGREMDEGRVGRDETADFEDGRGPTPRSTGAPKSWKRGEPIPPEDLQEETQPRGPRDFSPVRPVSDF